MEAVPEGSGELVVIEGGLPPPEMVMLHEAVLVPDAASVTPPTKL